jgi:plasmid stabilization system protein ParE
MQVRFGPDAEREFQEAVEHYLVHASPATAQQLEQEMTESAGLMAGFPDGFTALAAGARRCPLRSFPYQLVYIVQAGGILVLAFMHQKRRPGYWRKRVSRSKPQ